MDDRDFYEIAKKHCPLLNAFAVTVHCGHETRYKGMNWNSPLFLKSYNAAGIKATKDWTGATINSETWEQFANGTKQNTVGQFRAYDDIADFLSDYQAKIVAMYPLTVKRNDSFLGYFDGLLSGKYRWATDKDYFEKLLNRAYDMKYLISSPYTAEARFKEAADYAVRKDYLTDEHKVLLQELMNKVRVPMVNIPSNVIKKVCIDYGHGGSDPGACQYNCNESIMNAELGKLIVERLVASDVEVYLSRVGDRTVSLTERALYANENKCDLFVSIHHNSSTNQLANGFEVHIPPNATNSRELAKKIITAVETEGICKIRGIKESNFTVLLKTQMPAVLIEAGFISNPKEAKSLRDPLYMTAMANAIARAILKYLVNS